MKSNVNPKCNKATKAGTPCRKPAGNLTDHVGFGPCSQHGGNNEYWQNTANDSLLEKAQQYMDDPNLFDLRRELASLKVLYEELLNQVDENRNDLPRMQALRNTIMDMASIQEKAFKILTQNQFYMTVAQAVLVIKQLGSLWYEEMLKAQDNYPALTAVLTEVQNNVARRIPEIDMPQLPASTE